MAANQPTGAADSLFAGPVADAILSADSTKLFVATGSSVIKFDVVTGTQEAVYALSGTAGAMDVSADGKTLAVIRAGSASAFDRIDLATGAAENLTITGARPASAALNDIAFVKDGSILLTDGTYNIVRYDAKAGGYSTVFSEVAVQTLVSSDDHAKIFMMSGGASSQIYTSGRGITATHAYNPYEQASMEGTTYAVGAVSRDNLKFLQGVDGTLRNGALSKIGFFGTDAAGFAFGPANDVLYVLGANGLLKAFDVATYEVVAAYYVGIVLKPVTTAPHLGNELQISDDGRFLIALTAAGITRFDLQALQAMSTGGDDVLTEGPELYGLDGNDRFIGQGGQRMYGGRGDDTYLVRRYDGPAEAPNEGTDTVITSLAAYALSANIENLTSKSKTGAVLLGNDLDNVIRAGIGNDTINAAAGNDLIDGGAGIDTASYLRTTLATRGQVNVSLAITTEQDTGAGGKDTLVNVENLIGTEFNDTLTGNGEANRIDGGNGNDKIDGGAGSDVLNGGDGEDTMSGGSGDDTYFVNETADKAIEAPGGGIDSVTAGASFVLSEGVENLTLVDTGYYDDFSGTGNSGNNVILGNARGNVLDGRDGRDRLVGGGGNDTLSGSDTVIAKGAGDDRLDGGSGIDLLTYAKAVGGVTVDLGIVTAQDTRGAGTDLVLRIENLTGSGFADTLSGNSGKNLLDGGRGVDTLFGYGGDDRLDGGSGKDSLFGGAGNDTYLVDNTGDRVSENGGASGSDPADAGGSDIVLASATFSMAGGDGAQFIEKLTLTGFAAIDGTGNALANLITGNYGSNRLVGGLGDDTLSGDGGDDILDGGGGNDRMSGGSNNDTYIVDSADDKVSESSPDDPNDDSGGNDTVRAGVSFNLDAGTGVRFIENLVLTGSDAIDGTGNGLDNTLTGNGAANIISGGSGNDTLDGQGGSDRLDGGIYADNLLGGAGDDTLNGGADFDTLTGGTGRDVMTGGTGADTFIFGAYADFAGATSAAADRITDFSAFEYDRIRLRALDANPATIDAYERFTFIADAAFSGAAGQLRAYQSGGNTYVTGDTNGDKAADFMIVLTGLHILTAESFEL